MKMKTKLREVVGVVTLLFVTLGAQAQTLQEALESYNAAAKLDNAKNYAEAIKQYEKTISMYDALEDSENQYSVKSANRIPVLQYKYALGFYKQKKYDETIAAFEKLVEYSDTYNNAEYAKKGNAIIPKLYYAKGKSLMDKGQNDEALVELNKSIELNPKYGMSYIRMAQIYSEKNDETNFSATLEKASALKQSKVSATAEKLAKAFYSKNGATAFQKGDFTEAEKHFIKLTNYMENDDVYYQLASIYNKQSKWDKAIEAANKAIELFTEEGTTKDARLYFELGSAYKGKGDNTAACDAYKKAARGDYEEAANYEIKHTLKCQ